MLFSSPTDAIFYSPACIELFGEYEWTYTEQYGMFHLPADSSVLQHDAVIRLLTVYDEDKVLAFDEPYIPYHNNLRNTFESCIRTGDKSYVVYVYMDDVDILGYLIANTLNGSYWDINYIYVSEKARGNGVAKHLAHFYAKATQDAGGFASYGTPENEASKKVALACGFERFETKYLAMWQAVS